jgi:type IV pilus assembly protein PilA
VFAEFSTSRRSSGSSLAGGNLKSLQKRRVSKLQPYGGEAKAANLFMRGHAMGSDRGFTLIEMLVVSAIIGVLAAIAIPQYASYKAGAADAEAKSDLHNMATAMEAYYTKVSTYSGASVATLIADYGFRQTPAVSVGIATANATHYVITANATSGSGTFTFDSVAGTISGP